jgi:hypothetical protein
MAEAIGAAVFLWRVTGDPEYERWYQRFWSFTDRYLIDREHGGWRHQLDSDNRPADTVWKGKPDAYHAYQATLFAELDPRRGLVGSLLRAQSSALADWKLTHLLPFQCKSTTSPPALTVPTAQALLAEPAATP